MLQCSHQWIADKSIADSMEALIGCFLTTCGTMDTMKFMTSWLGIRVLPTPNDGDSDIGFDEVMSTDEEKDGELSDSDGDTNFDGILKQVSTYKVNKWDTIEQNESKVT